MAVSLNTNISALGTQRRLGETIAKLNKSFDRLSSGLRICTAGDDAAGLALSESLKADSRVFTQGIRNLNDGVSLTNIAESTLNEMTNIVTRIQELAQQAANGTLSDRQRASIDAEAQALAKEYFRVSRVAEFNGLRLFDGSTQGLRFQAGYGESGGISASLGGKLGTGTVSGNVTYDGQGVHTWDVQLADFNGDGNLDMVYGGSTAFGNGYVATRLGAGDGTFGEATSFAAESGTMRAITVGDVNGDRIIDLITAGASDTVGLVGGRTTIRLGRGDGTFADGVSYAAEATHSYAVALADLNGDSAVDLVTGGESSADGYVTIRLNSGNGTFGGAISYLVQGQQVVDLKLVDLNNDANLDLVTAGTNDAAASYLSVQLGEGDGTFGNALSYSAPGTSAGTVSVADLNADGALDVVVASYFNFGSWLGAGDGTFTTQRSYSSDITRAAVLADLNGDNILDYAASGWKSGVNDGLIMWRMGMGDGQFGTASTAELFGTDANTYFGTSIAAGDVNSDGVTDIVGGGYVDVGAGWNDMTQVLLGDTREGVSPILPFSLKTKANALQSVPMLAQTLARISSQRGTIGALQSRLNTAVANLQVARENYDSARSQITDVDVANESSQLLKTQIVQQAATSILTQANQAPALALNLLRG